jgi:hypothetical protein
MKLEFQADVGGSGMALLKPTPVRTRVSQVLRKAREIMEMGWAYGTRDDGEGHHCALGAIGKASGDIYSPDDEAIEAVAKHIPRNLPHDPVNCFHDDPVGWVARFNNTQGKDATLALFQRAIEAEESGQPA